MRRLLAFAAAALFSVGFALGQGAASPKKTAAVSPGPLMATFRGDVDAKANVFSAGHPKGNVGLPPTAFKLPRGTNRVLIVKTATGKVSCCGPNAHFNGADGGTDYHTSINTSQGIAGIVDNKHAMFLVGVFLDASEPKDQTPDRLDVTAMESQEEVSPGLRQTFYVGDGLTGEATGEVQKFHVPEGATRLFLGFADSNGFGGDPGAFDDNVGKLAVVLEVRQGKAQFTVKTEGGHIGITLNEAVLFGTAEHSLKPQAEVVLAQIKTAVLDKHPNAKIRVEGHTDDVGSESYNQQLSRDRADAVATWFKTHGVEAARIEAVGYGKSRPKVPNTNAANRAKNRRVEIMVE